MFFIIRRRNRENLEINFFDFFPLKSYDVQHSKRAFNGKFSQFYFLGFHDVAIFNLSSGIILFAKSICLIPQ